MASACHQVAEGTVLNSAHFFYAHPSIFATSATIHLYMTMATTPPLSGERLCHRGENKLSNPPNPPDQRVTGQRATFGGLQRGARGVFLSHRD